MLYFRKIIEQQRTSPKNVGTFTLEIEVMQEKINDTNIIIQYIQLNLQILHLKNVTKGIQRLAEMEPPANLRQYAFTITKRTIKSWGGGTVNSEQWRIDKDDWIYNQSKIVLLNTEIYNKVNSLVNIISNELDDLRLKQNETRNDFHISSDWFYVALASKDNEQKKAIVQIKHIKVEDVRETHLCILKMKTC